MYGHKRINRHSNPLRTFSIINTTGPSSRPKCQGETHQPNAPLALPCGCVGLKDDAKPYVLVDLSLALWIQKAIVGSTIFGANGNEVTAAQGASVPSSGPKGTPRAA